MSRQRLFDRKMLVLIALFILSLVLLIKVAPVATLDTRFFYTNEEGRGFLESLSPAEKHTYLINEIFDLIFIGTYSCLSFVFLRRLFSKNSQIAWLGFIAGGFDLIETLSILGYLAFDVTILPALGYVTLLKWVSANLCIFLILAGAVRLHFFNSLKT